MESFQTSGYIILPIVLLFIGQFTGLFQLNAVIFLMIAAALIVVDFILWALASRTFTPERLLK